MKQKLSNKFRDSRGFSHGQRPTNGQLESISREKIRPKREFRPRIDAVCARHLAAVLAAQQLIVKSCTVKTQDGAFQGSIDVQIDWPTIYLAQSLNFVQRAVRELYILLGSMATIRYRSA